MRTYPNNSPQAAARIVGLAMLSDGYLCKAELDVLDRLDIHGQLGLQPDELHAVVHSLCADLLAAVILAGAWREYAGDNRRDAGLLATIGTGGMLAGAAVWLA